MQTLPRICLLALLSLLMFSVILAVAQAEPSKTCQVPSKNQTIQQAIFDPTCDVVHIGAGTHMVNLKVDRQVIIEGEGTDQTILDGGDADRVIVVFNGATSNGDATIRNLTIQNGRDDITGGGGIMNEANVSVTDVRIINNHGRTGAGLLNLQTATLERVEISGNIASGGGGGVHTNQGLTLTNVTISGNRALSGSGLSSGGSGKVILINSTIYTNTDDAGFATIGIYGTLTTTNSIIAGGNAINCDGTGTVVSAGYNLADDTSCGLTSIGDQENIDPKLKPLADNGGSSWTHAPDATSPAIDMGTNASCPAVDQRGVARPQAIVSGKTAVCDIGAHEATLNKVFLPIVFR